MPKVFLTSRSGLLGRLVDFRLLSPAREMRSLVERSWQVPDQRATVGVREIQPRNMASITAADPDHGPACLDAVAGSEFVDDRIRLRE
jgi:hypothetical protein